MVVLLVYGVRSKQSLHTKTLVADQTAMAWVDQVRTIRVIQGAKLTATISIPRIGP
jgi:hypothetical protein